MGRWEKSTSRHAEAPPCRWRRQTPPARDARQDGLDGRVDGADEHWSRRAARRPIARQQAIFRTPEPQYNHDLRIDFTEGSGRTYLAAAQEAQRWEHCRRKPPENSPASRPRSTSKASMASRKLVPAPRQTPLQPYPYCATAVARPSDAIGGPDRDQPRLLCPPTRAAWAALRGRTIIWHRQTPDRPPRPERLIYFHARPEGPSLTRERRR